VNQISMSGDVSGRMALPHLVDPHRAASEDRDGCTVAAMSATAVDGVSAAVIRASLEEHHSSGSTIPAEYFPPVDPGVDQTLDNLLGTLPEGTSVCRSAPAPARDRFAVAPALSIRDVDEIEPLVLGIRAIGPHVGLTVVEAGFAAAVAQVLAENGLEHAPESPCGLVLSAGVDPASSQLTVASINLGNIAGTGDPAGDEVIRQAVGRSRQVFGGLTSLIQRAQGRGLPLEVYLAAGTQEAIWKQRWGYSVREHVPGWCTAVTLRRT
jgi:hypothetical protein